MRTRRIVSKWGLTGGIVGAVAVVVGLLLSAAPASASGPGCDDGNVCVWENPYYDGGKAVVDCSVGNQGGWFNFGILWQSAKNRCGDRLFELRDTNFDHTHCLDPGDNRPHFDYFMYWLHVGALGSRCP
jgi:hypothetical protein